MYQCSVCDIKKTVMWRFDENENVYCNPCGMKRTRRIFKRTKENMAEISRQRRRRVSIEKLAAIIDKIQTEEQKNAIIAILAKNCEAKVAEQLAAGEEVHVDISDVRKPCTFWRRLEDIVK